MPLRKATWSWSDVKPSGGRTVAARAASVTRVIEKVKPVVKDEAPAKVGAKVGYIRTIASYGNVDFASMPYGLKDI